MRILCATIGYVIGIIGGLYFNKNIVPFFLIVLLFLGMIKRYIPKNIKRYSKFISKQFFFFFCIFFIIGISYILVLEKFYTKTYENVPEEMQVTAMITSDVKETKYQKQYTIKVISPSKYKNTYLLLKTKKDISTLQYGKKIAVIGKFEKASIQRNEGGFDYAKYLRTKKIQGLFNAQKVEIINLRPNIIEYIDISIHQLAEKIEGNLLKIMGREESALLSGILIGRTRELPEEIKEDFRASNLSHMLAVSGSHVSYVLILVSFLIGKIPIRKEKI